MSSEIPDGVIADAIQMVAGVEELPPYVNADLMVETADTLTAWAFTAFEAASEEAAASGTELTDDHLGDLISRAIQSAYIVGRIDDAIQRVQPSETTEVTGKSGATYVINNYFH